VAPVAEPVATPGSLGEVDAFTLGAIYQSSPRVTPREIVIE
jgi:hypothetical protein